MFKEADHEPGSHHQMPPTMAATFFKNVFRAKPFPGADGYYQYPCNAKFDVALSFAGSATTYQIPSECKLRLRGRLTVGLHVGTLMITPSPQ